MIHKLLIPDMWRLDTREGRYSCSEFGPRVTVRNLSWRVCDLCWTGSLVIGTNSVFLVFLVCSVVGGAPPSEGERTFWVSLEFHGNSCSAGNEVLRASASTPRISHHVKTQLKVEDFGSLRFLAGRGTWPP